MILSAKALLSIASPVLVALAVAEARRRREAMAGNELITIQGGPMIDIGIITGSGIYRLTGNLELHPVETRFGEADVAVTEVGPWTVGAISRHGVGHHHLPHTVPHQANLSALKHLGARAVLATTAVGMVDPGIPLGQPILFDDLFFPENLLPTGAACTIFTEPGEPSRGHLIQDEPFAPRLRRKMELAAASLGLEVTVGGVYAHTNGPRFETKSEIRWLNSVGVTAVSQTCGPEVVLTGELELPYVLVGFPVNYATGIAKPESEQELSYLLGLSAKILTRLVLRTAEILEEQDLVYDHGFVYRVDGGLGGTEDGLAPGAVSEEKWVGDATIHTGRRAARCHPLRGRAS
jgi:5'-methylthioadenosine phosphorylase